MYGFKKVKVVKSLVSMFKTFISIQNKKKLRPTGFKLVNQTLVAIGFEVCFNEFSFRYKIIT